MSATEVCEPLQMMISSTYEWIWNSTYQNLCDKARNIIKKNVTMAFYNEKQWWGLGTDLLEVSLGKVFCKWGMECDSQGMKLLTMECCSLSIHKQKCNKCRNHYINIEWEALGILNGLGEFHH